jgi:hypothetical protein
MFCGRDVHSALIGIQDGSINVSPSGFTEIIGADVKAIDIPGAGRIHVVLDLHGFKEVAGQSDKFYLVDPAHIRKRSYNGMSGIMAQDLSHKHDHKFVDELYCSIGLEVAHGDSPIHATGHLGT